MSTPHVWLRLEAGEGVRLEAAIADAIGAARVFSVMDGKSVVGIELLVGKVVVIITADSDVLERTNACEQATLIGCVVAPPPTEDDARHYRALRDDRA